MEKMFEMLNEKAEELRNKTQEIILADGLSKNTRQTKLYHVRRERKIISLVTELLHAAGDVQLSDTQMETLQMLAGKRNTAFYVEAGESIISIMERYPNRRNLMKSIVTYCDEHGLVFDTESMTVYADE